MISGTSGNSRPDSGAGTSAGGREGPERRGETGMSDDEITVDIDHIANNGIAASPAPGNRQVLIRTFVSGRMGLCVLVTPIMARYIAQEILAAADRCEGITR